MLRGDLSHFDYAINSLISDCGTTQVFKAKIACLDCTECCNEDGGCIEVSATWPKSYIKEKNISPGVYVLLLMFGTSLILSLASIVLNFLGKTLPLPSRFILKNFNLTQQIDGFYHLIRWLGLLQPFLCSGI